MEHLKEKLDQLIEGLSEDKKEMIRDRLDNLASVYPFNEYEYIISSLMGFGENFFIKPTCADVFVWVAVWRDVIKYWVLSSAEVERNKYYSKGQHGGNVGEGQLHIKDEKYRRF